MGSSTTAGQDSHKCLSAPPCSYGAPSTSKDTKECVAVSSPMYAIAPRERNWKFFEKYFSSTVVPFCTQCECQNTCPCQNPSCSASSSKTAYHPEAGIAMGIYMTTGHGLNSSRCSPAPLGAGGRGRRPQKPKGLYRTAAQFNFVRQTRNFWPGQQDAGLYINCVHLRSCRGVLLAAGEWGGEPATARYIASIDHARHISTLLACHL